MSDNTPVKKPIVFSPAYNVGNDEMQRHHPFDLCKFSRVFNELVERGLIARGQEITPSPLAESDLLAVHTPEYVAQLNDKDKVAEIFEIPLLAQMPIETIKKLFIDPIMHHAAGSIAAADVAKQAGWAINLGGGFHHASAAKGHGYCAVADITLAIKNLRDKNPDIRKIMIIDLDAHQGDGHEIDFKNDKDVYIIDMYNKKAFPGDMEARKRADINEGLRPRTKDKKYLPRLRDALKQAEASFKPDAIFYIAGTDILAGDTVGRLAVSRDGVIKRDEMVFEYALTRKIPIVMLFGGGYQKSNAMLIADSIENLDKKFSLLTPHP